MLAKKIIVKGTIQGVGFRPLVYRLATELNLKGIVFNTNESVQIHVEGREEDIDELLKKIYCSLPSAAMIESIGIVQAKITGYTSFSIVNSSNISNNVTRISPDIAVCSDCINDMYHQHHRKNFPLINCSHCGPRFSIIKALPYDRCRTTMQVFKMCNLCAFEYENPLDRRFHAQPIACNYCGPKYTLSSYIYETQQWCNINDIVNILKRVSEGIEQGKIYALKGLGGYNLVCDATNEIAVNKLRKIKKRDTKPFAVMFKNIDTIEKYCYLNPYERIELESFRRPIVILNLKKSLAQGVSLFLSTVGALLPYMPFHYLLFDKIKCSVLVMTSANISDNPIIIDDEEAKQTFGELVDGIVSYNRKIYNRIDDSVKFVISQQSYFIRRSRGFVPESITIAKKYTEGIFAAGAELTGAFAIGKGNEAILSQYIGDLKSFENYNFYKEAYEHFIQIFRFEPKLAIADLHPDYHSTLFAYSLGIPVYQVQHHFAHVASVLAEYGIEDEVIGIAFDGTGYGLDGNIWGGEFLICTPKDFVRYKHFEYIPLPGGDKVVDQPWRTLISYLNQYFGNKLYDFNIPLFNHISSQKIQQIQTAIEKNINCPLSSSAGRLFDAIAVLLKQSIIPSFHAEAPMRLEAILDDKYPFLPYSFEITQQHVSFLPMFYEILQDLEQKISVSIISKRFHDTIIQLIVNLCIKIRNEKNIHKVVLTGGVFQNRYLLAMAIEKLKNNNFTTLTNTKTPINDGGIALGQIFIGSCLVNNNNKYICV